MAIEHHQVPGNPNSTDEVRNRPAEVLLGLQSTEIVLGLHWDPPASGADVSPADLDALCVLYGPHGEVREVVHPGNPRSANGSVVHTGDSRTGASTWDDERIFVFLSALPVDVAELAFVVISASGHAFDRVCGAVCHVSDRATEAEWLRTDLTSFSQRVSCTVATLHRDASTWRILSDSRPSHDGLPVEVQSLLERSKHSHAPVAPSRRRRVSGPKP